MKKSVLVLSAALVASLGAGALYAASPASPPPAQAPAPMGDGSVTWDAFKAQADAVWARMDVNKDGRIDQADRDARMGQRFDAIDTNHDGMISRAEFLAQHRGPKGGRDQMAGPDGSTPPPAVDRGAGMDHMRMGHGGMGRGGKAMSLIWPVLRQAKRDNGGVLTRAAYDAAVKSAFDKADGNHDGKLTREEIRAASGQAGRPWGRQGMRHRDGERMGGAPVLQDSDGN